MEDMQIKQYAMRETLISLVFSVLVLITWGCAGNGYPENRTNKERRAYYQAFNESKTDAEWNAIRSKGKPKKKEKMAVQDSNEKDLNKTTAISFRVKNNSLLPKKLKIVDNILVFKPFEIRYFGFEPNTNVYLITGQKEKYLFSITKNDEGKEFKILE
jgi:hypothetical protein